MKARHRGAAWMGRSVHISTYDDGGEMEKYYWCRQVFPLESGEFKDQWRV